jgi:putative NADPH-quinone reductase
MGRACEPKRILLIEGHPDAAPNRFGHALANAYAEAAERSGHELRRIAVAELRLPLLASKEEWESEASLPAIRACGEDVEWAEHLVILYPLWLGSMPAMLKGFFEQVFRPGIAVGAIGGGKSGRRLLAGKSARIIVTMGMPALIYRWYYRAHSVKSLKRSTLGFCGIAPIRVNLIGMVEAASDRRRRGWLRKMKKLGRCGD